MIQTCKIFISIPMCGRSAEEIRFEQHKIFNALKTNNVQLELLQNVFDHDDALDPVACLARSIMLLSHASIILFAPGWQNARGCKIEHDIAHAYDLVHIEVDESGNYFIDADCPALKV